MATVPGTTAKHAIIKPECQAARGVEGAIDEALQRLRDEYMAIMEGWKTPPTFHVVLTIQRPERPRGRRRCG